MTAWPWPSSESTVKVIAAFVAALQAVEDVVKTKRVNAGAMNYSYADLDTVLEASKPVLTANDLAVAQAASGEGVHAILMHTTGEWLSFPPYQVHTQQNTPQGQGSALTYARRYQMLALLGIATEDDDGTAASKKPKAAATRPGNVSATGEIVPPRTTRLALNGDKATPAQIRMAGALFNGRGWTERDERLARTADLIGRTIGSWDELSKAEMGDMLDKLKAAES